jgi:hypothetical protein
MPKFNHMYDIAFTVISNTEDGSDVTPAMLRAALLRRAAELAEDEFIEACGLCDTYEMED